MYKIHIDVEGLEKLLVDLQGFEYDLEHREEPLEEAKERQISRWQRNYMSQGGEYQTWAPNAPSTIRERQRMGYQGWPPLLVTGRMLTHFSRQNQEGTVSSSAIEWNFENENQGDRWVSTVSHHTGYRLGRSRVPARRLWDLDRKDEDALKDIFERFITNLIAKYDLG